MNFLSPEDTFKYIPLIPDGNFIEFGVYTGNIFKRIVDYADSINKPFKLCYGLDAFKGGLPKETENVYKNPDWSLGVFDLCKDYNLNSVEEAISFVKNKIQKDNLILIPGYFSETLTKNLAKQIGKTISYCHIDTDIHSSSKEVLDFIFKYQILLEGCLIRFDDFNSTPNNGGQRLALTQTIARYNFSLDALGDNVFMLLRYGV